jgi:hypothetical protein
MLEEVRVIGTEIERWWYNDRFSETTMAAGDHDHRGYLR